MGRPTPPKQLIKNLCGIEGCLRTQSSIMHNTSCICPHAMLSYSDAAGMAYYIGATVNHHKFVQMMPGVWYDNKSDKEEAGK